MTDKDQEANASVREAMQPHFDVLASILGYFHANGMVEDKRRLDATITAFGQALEANAAVATANDHATPERPMPEAERQLRHIEHMLNEAGVQRRTVQQYTSDRVYDLLKNGGGAFVVPSATTPTITPLDAGEQEALFEYRKNELYQLMSDISEDCYCAGWMMGNEFRLWQAITDQNDDRQYGMGEIEPGQIERLRELSRLVDGWWVWDEGAEFVTLAEWAAIRAKIAEKNAVGSNGKEGAAP